jgi:hypothetical protein
VGGIHNKKEEIYNLPIFKKYATLLPVREDTTGDFEEVFEKCLPTQIDRSDVKILPSYP